MSDTVKLSKKLVKSYKIGRIEEIRNKCNKLLVISGRDVKFIIDCYESAIFWKNMAYFGVIFMAAIIIAMSISNK